MKELVEYIAQSLVDDPTSVQVREQRQGDRVWLNLSVARPDMGKVIGKDGRIAHAIRNVVKVAAIQQGVRVNLEID